MNECLPNWILADNEIHFIQWKIPEKKESILALCKKNARGNSALKSHYYRFIIWRNDVLLK